jgi:hypothetical protein
MNKPAQPVQSFGYDDLEKELPLPCPCGFTAPGEIVEYYRLYHVLGCMRCQTRLAIVAHPVPDVSRQMDIRREELNSMVA